MLESLSIGVLGVILAIVVQTAVVAAWLGRLAQRVTSMQQQLDEMRGRVVGKDECSALHASHSQRMGLIEMALNRMTG